MKALRVAALLMLGAAFALGTPAEAVAQVHQLDAEINIIPDKHIATDNGVRISFCIVGIPCTSQRIDSIDLIVGEKTVAANDIDGVDFGRPFQFEDTGVQVIEVDFPFKGQLPKGSTVTFHTEKGDVTAPARQ